MKKRILSAIISAFIALNTYIPTLAEPTAETPASTPTASAVPESTDTAPAQTPTQETQQPGGNENANPQATPEIDLSQPAPHAQSAVLADMQSGKILFSKNADTRVYPASTTKILTAILVLENDQLSDVVTASQEAIAPITNKHSHMGILVGEELTVEQLLYGMLVYSANDAANVLAVHTAGSLDAFVGMMNQKAAELGATGSHFANPHGFHEADHYTTAMDLFKIAQYAMRIDKFREIVKTDMYTIEPTNKYKEIRYLSSTNHLISRRRYANYYYDKAIGIKTGYTDEAGSCLVSAAVNGDTELISVVMNCANTTTVANGAYSFVDSKGLLEYGFENFKHIDIASAGDIVSDSSVYEAKDGVRVALTVDNNVNYILPVDYNKDEIETVISYNDKKISAPIAKGDVLGEVNYKYRGESIGTAKLVATNSVDKDYIIAAIHLIIKIVLNPVFLIVLAVFIILRIRAKRIQARRRRNRRSRLQHFDAGRENYNGERENQ